MRDSKQSFDLHYAEYIHVPETFYSIDFFIYQYLNRTTNYNHLPINSMHGLHHAFVVPCNCRRFICSLIYLFTPIYYWIVSLTHDADIDIFPALLKYLKNRNGKCKLPWRFDNLKNLKSVSRR